MADDPFDWDVDRVVTEFTTAKRTWGSRSKAPKLPDPAQFEAVLYKHEVDGEVLLTVEDFQDLFNDLGIQTSKHKTTLRNAINELRRRSGQYQRFLREQASPADPDNHEHDKESSPEPSRAPSLEPAPKKRRLDLTQMTQNLTPEEAQQNISRVRDPKEPPAETETSANFVTPDGDYYNWASGVTPVQMFDETDTTGLPMFEEDLTMNMVQDRPVPPKRVLQVNRVLKRRLLASNRNRYNGRTKSDMVKCIEGAEDIVPLLGESDDEYDSETLEEMREEAEEAEQDNDLIDLAQINQIIDEAIQQMISGWEERKLPRLQKKAYDLWHSTRHPVILRKALSREQNDLRHLENRLAKQREDICTNSWDSILDIKDQTRILEATVMDKQTAAWNLQILNSQSKPAKPPPQRRAAPRRRGPSKTDTHKGEEILTSESEDDLDNFIVDADEHTDVDEAASIPTLPRVDGDGDEYSPQYSPEYSPHYDPPVQDDMVGVESAATGDVEAHVPPIPQPLEADNHMDLDQYEDQEQEARKRHVAANPTRQVSHDIIDLTSSPPPESPLQVSPPPETHHSKGSERFNDETTLMDLDDMEGVRKVIAQAIKALPRGYMEAIFSMFMQIDPDNLWNFTIVPALQEPFPKLRGSDDKDSFFAFQIVRLFDGWSTKNVLPIRHYKRLDDEETKRIIALNYNIQGSIDTRFKRFATFIKDVSYRFNWEERKVERKPLKVESQSLDLDEDLEASGNSGHENEDVEDVIEREMASKISPSKKHKTPKIDKSAQNLRKNIKAQQREQAERAKAFHQRSEAEGQISGEKKQTVINVSKEDDQGIVCVNQIIAPDIRPHQVDGVRFMWNQITNGQGCLLAHTMGLGKTMQVITLLLAIAEAADSDDETVSCQVPEDLRKSQTLVLCPPGLVTNWLDELDQWAPDGSILGNYIRCDATLKNHWERADAIDHWCENGGVLVMGHEFFSGTKTLTDKQRDQLTSKAAILVVDEAHKMKNPQGRLHQTTSHFRTQSRIALTGSPLANNVLEYHTLINWLAPNYLSNISEFRATYQTPIKEGLEPDSTRGQRSKALKMLRVLTTQVAPLINRATIAVVGDLLPKKQEFVLHVPPTDLQRALYAMYIDYQNSQNYKESRLASLEALRPLLAHPAVFRRSLDQPARLDRIRSRREDGDDEEEDGEDRVTLPQALVSQLKMVLNKFKKQMDNLNLSSKIPLLCAILDESKRCGDHVLVFCRSIPALDYLEKLCKDQRRTYSRLDGSTAMDKRQGMVMDFNKNPRDVYLISTMAGGVGLNITGANRVVIFDFKFNPQDEQQAIGRAYRIGQKKPVVVYRLVCGGTFEEKLLSQAIFKMQLTSRVIDIKNPVPKAKAFDELFRHIEDPPQTDLSEHEGKDNILDNLLQTSHVRGLLRKIDMMDTFEEERLEEIQKDMTDEDRAEAERLINMHNDRLSGKPNAAEFTSFPPATQPVLLSYQQPARPVHSNAIRSSNGAYYPGLEHSSAPLPSTAPVLPSSRGTVTRPADTAIRSSDISMRPPYSPRPDTNSAPLVPIAGASTVIGVGSDRVHLHPKMKAFKGELVRSFDFDNQAPAEIRGLRKQLATDIAVAVGNAYGAQSYDKVKCHAITKAAESHLFVDAFVRGKLKPTDMVSMDPGQISEYFDTPGNPPHRSGGAVVNNEIRENPKHRLQKVSAHIAATPATPGHTEPATKSHRLDDRQAMEGVLARRNYQKQQQTQYQNQQPGARGPRLPDWAQKNNLDEAAKRKHIVPPQSSLSTPLPQASKPRPPARSPFS